MPWEGTLRSEILLPLPIFNQVFPWNIMPALPTVQHPIPIFPLLSLSFLTPYTAHCFVHQSPSASPQDTSPASLPFPCSDHEMSIMKCQIHWVLPKWIWLSFYQIKIPFYIFLKKKRHEDSHTIFPNCNSLKYSKMSITLSSHLTSTGS